MKYLVTALLLLWLAPLVAFVMESHPLRSMIANWRALPGGRRWAVALFLLASSILGADKGPLTPQALAHFLTASPAGTLEGPGAARVATAAQLAALRAYSLAASNIVAAATQEVAAVSAEIAGLEALAAVDAPVAYLAADLTAAAPAESNIVCRTQAVTVSNAVASFFVSVSATPAAAPEMEWYAELADGMKWRFQPVTNSFPQTFKITNTVGVVNCYRYDCAMPAAVTNIVLRPQYAMIYGGPYAQNFRVGAVEIDGEPGYTGSFSPDAFPGLTLQVQGGVVVGYTFYNSDGWTAEWKDGVVISWTRED